MFLRVQKEIRQIEFLSIIAHFASARQGDRRTLVMSLLFLSLSWHAAIDCPFLDKIAAVNTVLDVHIASFPP